MLPIEPCDAQMRTQHSQQEHLRLVGPYEQGRTLVAGSSGGAGGGTSGGGGGGGRGVVGGGGSSDWA